ncbi:Tail Collar domain protein [Sulfuricurvum kujiense DSM 16994]|uniref:Tail Collar domain protein n=1 Tax=Sulfuricurvum kujiense (strain ATCC BAA-921 / DSM 16994 / JCM 11577 / YK-1) TaxID=709032 RepID=E4U0G0_SULKY|nr:tail fiber protein [Sulfuricurvum kujiense]ADR33257.1 Tail Collar domain protein [Sulfuricurvum kujiense DSM 16994]
MKCYYLSALTALTFASSAFACGDSDYMGSICTTAAAACPAGTLEANGQLLTISQNQALYSLVGPYFGGDGKVNFALPDLRGRAPVGYGQNSDTSNVQFAKPRGQENVTLTVANLPAHTHSAAFNPGSGTNPITVTVPVSTNTSGNVLAPDNTHTIIAGTPTTGSNSAAMWSNTMTSPVNVKGITVSGDTSSGSVTLATTGAAAPVPTISPELGLKYCVVSRGVYPPRP